MMYTRKKERKISKKKLTSFVSFITAYSVEFLIQLIEVSSPRNSSSYFQVKSA